MEAFRTKDIILTVFLHFVIVCVVLQSGKEMKKNRSKTRTNRKQINYIFTSTAVLPKAKLTGGNHEECIRNLLYIKESVAT